MTNQVPPLAGVDLFRTDLALRASLAVFAPDAPLDDLERVGALAGSAEAIALGFDANENPPKLVSFDANGNRIDEVRFHPAWHRLLEHATGIGLHAAAWHDARPAPHARRAAAFYVWSQAEAGHGCPISMTYAAVAALREQPDVAAIWEPRLAARAYEPELAPIALKRAALCGMAMTEKQGGSDVRANATRAVPLARRGPGRTYALSGQKWFCSAPMSDAFLVLAHADAGLSCFLVPRMLDDGTRNVFRILRLKEKLGNRSNASAEVELDTTHGLLIGDEGRGLAVILNMVNATRLDCLLGSASLMRQALVQAVHAARHRRAFGALLAEQPLMRNVLADLALEVEAATWLAMRVAATADRADVRLRRIGTAVGKYWLCKRAPAVVAEALECLGGNGYVETSVLPRLYREAPLNSIWEGAGNINALDVLRVLRKDDAARDALYEAWEPGTADERVAAAVRELRAALEADDDREARARWIAERAALVWQAALLVQHAPADIADAFVRSRIAGEWGRALGTLPPGCNFASILERAWPAEAAVA